MVLTDSCWALSIKEQVLTTRMSASSACGVNWAPACASIPIMTSLSTRFLGHPRLIKPTLGPGRHESLPAGGASGIATEEGFDDMRSLDSNILEAATFRGFRQSASGERID